MDIKNLWKVRTRILYLKCFIYLPLTQTKYTFIQDIFVFIVNFSCGEHHIKYIFFNLRLKDPSVEIRKATFFTLSGLILRDMIRAHSSIHLMVNSLTDPDKELTSMCRTFFVTLSQKENNLYNVLPDIFAHLMASQEITEEDSKNIMK